MLYVLAAIGIIAYFLIGSFVLGAVLGSWEGLDITMIIPWPLVICVLIGFKIIKTFYELGVELNKKLRKED